MSLALADRTTVTTELLDDDFASSPRFFHQVDPGGVHPSTATSPFGMRLLEKLGGVAVRPSMSRADGVDGGALLSNTYYHYSVYCYCGD